MILSRTLLRISFVGGGTDLPSFYENNDYGCVISASIDQYIYIGVNHRFDGKIRLAYAKNELIDSVNEIQNERMKVALKKLGIMDSIEVFYISDVPKKMGLGGSSTFTVGLLNALYSYLGEKAYSERLAREACNIEIDILKNPIGKQDQYAAAIGGLNYIKFWANGTVSVKPILIDENLIKGIMNNLIFIYLGQSHDASNILNDVNNNIKSTNSLLKRMRNITDELYKELMQRNINGFRDALKENWELKKRTSSLISTKGIEDLYKRAITYGAEAGKILGAGGGGYLMLYVPFEKQNYFKEKFSNYKTFKFNIDHLGSQIVHRD